MPQPASGSKKTPLQIVGRVVPLCYVAATLLVLVSCPLLLMYLYFFITTIDWVAHSAWTDNPWPALLLVNLIG